MAIGRYAAGAQTALTAGLIPAQYITSACPECGDQMEVGDQDAHVIIVDGEDQMMVAIACEGYLVIPPVLLNLGHLFPNWSDWTAGDDLA
jgi:hypothetical protein